MSLVAECKADCCTTGEDRPVRGVVDPQAPGRRAIHQATINVNRRGYGWGRRLSFYGGWHRQVYFGTASECPPHYRHAPRSASRRRPTVTVHISLRIGRRWPRIIGD